MKASVEINLRGLTDAVAPYAQGNDALAEIIRTLADGTTDESQVDGVYFAKLEPGAAATVTIDLSAITDSNGVAITATDMDLLAFFTPATPGIGLGSANGDNVEIGPNAANGFLGPWKAAANRNVLTPKGLLLFMEPASGYVIDGTHKIIDVINTDAGAVAVVYVFALVRSA